MEEAPQWLYLNHLSLILPLTVTLKTEFDL